MSAKEVHNLSRGGLGVWEFFFASVIIVSLSLFWHNYAMNSAVSEFTGHQIKAFKIHVIVIIAFQLILFWLLRWVFHILKIPKSALAFLFAVFMAGILTLNVFSLNVFHMEKFAELPGFTKFLLAGIGFFIAYSASTAVLNHRKLSMGFAVVSGLLLSFSYMQKHNLSGKATIENVNIKIGVPPINARNIYFISLDSMIPRSLAKKYLDLDDLAFINVLDEYKARIFKNSFSAFTPTKPAMNSLLTLDWEVFDTLPRDERLEYYPGKRQSFMSTLMHENGYKVQALYKNAYFGAEKGPYVDHYYNGTPDRLACDHVNKGVLLGFCEPSISALSAPMRPKDSQMNVSMASPKDLVGPILSRISAIGNEKQPWFTIAHIYMPGHTRKTFRYDNMKDLSEYRELYSSRTKTAADYLKRILDAIISEDPDAIVLITGDHGAYVSRGLEPNKIKDDAAREDALKFVVQDRKGINIAVWPGDVCETDMAKLQMQDFITNLEVGRAVVNCALSETVLPPMKRPEKYIKSFKPYIYE